MRLNKANLAGLTSSGQQSEMKSILAGAWPALKPLPVFKYETEGYRATISFDRKRGEWVCRKTSLPSNEVQELRGGLREITLALPHGEPEILTEGAEQQEPELEKDAQRRLEAIREWREKHENGALYFELRGLLSESQRTELDDSLRLSLTARQLQFNSKNVSSVFDDLSIAGGRFAALIEFAKRNKPVQGTGASAQEEGTLLDAESVIDSDTTEHDEHPLEISPPEFEDALRNNNPIVPHQGNVERCPHAEEFPVLSIKSVFPEPDQPSIAERMPHLASQQFEIEAPEITEGEFSSLAEHPHAEHSHLEDRPRVFADFAAQVPTGQPFANRLGGLSSRFPALKISAFQVNVFALLFLFAVTSFTVGLTVGRGPLGKRLREAPKSLLAADAKPPTPTLPDPAQPDAADESSSQPPTLPTAISDDSAGAKKPDAPAPSGEKPTAAEGKPKEIPQISDSLEARSADADSSPTKESAPPVAPEVNPKPVGMIGPVAPDVSPPTSPKLLRPSSKRVRRPRGVSKAARSLRSAPRTPAPYRLASAIAATPRTSSAAPNVPRASTILVTLPGQDSQPFRVSFPNKTIAATSSVAMTSQFSVLVPPEPAVAPKSARLEAGELVSFGWPRYLRPGGRYGSAETIRMRATIGQFGQVLEVKFLGGSASLLPATTEAIRQWRYTPTLLDRRPVQAQQDITIEFRPPLYTAQVSTRHPSHN